MEMHVIDDVIDWWWHCQTDDMQWCRRQLMWTCQSPVFCFKW